ncbi:MAG TPA: sugar phosphate isomerase/epimerase, partial [Pirellulaceae bacterium]|nr:sugar phosphate isomerase/epimerase [Pirellulaceae bacterium]
MSLDRRSFLTSSAALATAAAMSSTAVLSAAEEAAKPASPRRQPIGVSTYSFFKFGGNDNLPVEKCIEVAGEMGFDGVEILHVQMNGDSKAYLNQLKR